MVTKQILSAISQGKLDARLTALYGQDALQGQKKRYTDAVNAFVRLYGEGDAVLFSVPGRSELSGNHTDHNRGRVIAAAVTPDVIAVAAKREDDRMNVKSEGFSPDSVRIRGNRPDPALFFSSASLLCGICEGFTKRGYAVCGFDAYTTSNVQKGSGISSSAAFEVLIAEMESYFANGNRISAPELAEISQFAENVYFGKPCGLMDQTACAVGSVIAIDFADPKKAEIEKVELDLRALGYALCVTNTGGSHAKLNDEYAAIPGEMKAVAAALGQEVLRGITMEKLLAAAPALRKSLGDRAVLRAMHFIAENERVIRQTNALKTGDFDAYLCDVLASGRSSFMYLQNVYPNSTPKEQGLSLALAVTERLLNGTKSAWRVHGGGFAGTIQAYVPADHVAAYRAAMDALFGEGACSVFSIRHEGAAVVWDGKTV